MATSLIRPAARIIVGVLVLAFGFPIWFTWIAEAYLGIHMYLAGDFITYWSGARDFLARAPLYSERQLEGPYLLPDMDYGAGYVYPPTAAALSVPLAPLPTEVAWAIFSSAGVVVLGAVAYRIARREGLSRPLAGALLGVLMTSGPVAQAAIAGNVNLWVAAGLAMIWLRPSLCTTFSVAGALIKLYPAAGLIWSVRLRAWTWRPMIAAAIVAFIATAWLGISAWRDFAVSFENARPFGADFPQSPRMLLEPQFGPVIAAAISLAMALLLGFAALRLRSPRTAFFFISLAMIAPASEWHIHYFLLPLIGAFPGVSAFAARLVHATAAQWVAATGPRRVTAGPRDPT